MDPQPGQIRNAIVNGAAGGIGGQVMADLREDGFRVVGLDLRGDPDPAGHDVRRCDVTDEGEVVAKINGLVKELGGLDLLVNNAGIPAEPPLDEYHARQLGWRRWQST